MQDNFKTPDQDDKQLIVNTDYFNWLKKRNLQDIHAVKTKIAYLEELGFIVGENSLSNADLSRLQGIERFYFDREIKPKLKKQFIEPWN